MELAAVRMLPPDDQLTFLIGRLTRAAVDLDVAVRIATWELSGQVLHPRVGDRQFSDAVRRCRELVGQALPTNFVGDALSALDAAQAAYNARSRYAHDQFYENFDAPEFSQLRFGVSEQMLTSQPPRVDAQSVIDAVFNVLRQTARIRALSFLAMPNRDDGGFQGEILQGDKLYVHWSGACSISESGYLDESELSPPPGRRPQSSR